MDGNPGRHLSEDSIIADCRCRRGGGDRRVRGGGLGGGRGISGYLGADREDYVTAAYFTGIEGCLRGPHGPRRRR